jgi:D-alanyl-D-alanine carboxypeptidase
MISTASDLDRFFAALLGGELTSAAALTAMRDTVETGQIFRYGLGIQQYDLPCGTTVLGHGGELLGFLTYAMASPEGDRQLTLSYNPLRSPDGMSEIILGLFADAFCPLTP